MKNIFATAKKAAVCLLGAVLLFSACSAPKTSGGFASPEIVQNYGKVFSVTPEQRLEDYDFLWNTLRESYLYWGVVERKGLDPEEIYEEYRTFIAENPNDADFFVALNSMMFRLGGTGHLGLIEPDMYEYIRDIYADTPNRAHWHSELQNETTQKNYPAFGELLQAMNSENSDENFEDSSLRPSPNVTAFIIPGGETAYIKIGSFGPEHYENDRRVLFEFYKQTAGCKSLIIDITSNGGGAEHYWTDLLVAPHIEGTLSNDNYALVSLSDNNRPYMAGEDVTLLPISELPELAGLLPEDRARATHFYVSNRSVTASDFRSPFVGRIILLTGPNVYSSSEAFAVFCKDTGFAKLVGHTTGGDGIGIDPAFVRLPNTGILVRYSMIFGLNKDGGSNEEFGTAPDIECAENESALAKALEYLGKVRLPQ